MGSRKIIHIFDDDKFIDPTIKLFEEVVPGISNYYVNKKKGIEYKYVKSDRVTRIDFHDLQERIKFYEFINSDVNHIIFFHALNSIKQEIVINIDPKLKKVWFIWGYDLYGMWPLLKKNIYLPKTKTTLNVKSNFKANIPNSSFAFFLFRNRMLVKKISNRLFNILNNTFNTKFYQAAKRIDVVVTVVPSEYQVIKNMKLDAKYAPFTYGCLEDLLGNIINETVNSKPNILVGNSADPSNNHLDIFIKLSRLNLEGRKIYVPLSYSGNEVYKRIVIEEGRRLFGENFYPLTDFMPLEEYNKLLLSCGTLIFNHVRQQGVGNIIIMGHLGAKIYLNKKSPVYKYYKQEGIKIYDVDEIASKQFQEGLSTAAAAKNKQLFQDLYSRKKVHSKINTLLEIINKNE